MKKFMYLVAMSAFLFACSENDNPEPAVVEPGSGLTFEISAVNGMKDGNTRSNLYSQEPNQHVTRVSVYAFMNNGTNYTYAKTYDISGWSDGTTFKRYPVADADKLPAGDYKFLAVGRDASDFFTITAPTSSTTFESMMASVSQSGNESEIFAGWSQSQVMAQGSRISIEMSRKVAGLLGYFKNVPQNINGTTVQFIRLSITDTNQAVNLTNGVGITGDITPYNIINMDISGQAVNNGIYTGNDLSSQGVVKVSNSQLSGYFLIPVSSVQMTLGLYDANGNPLKTWVVKDSNGDSNLNILANNFYSLGTKVKAGNTNGGTSDPSDDDSPIDLLTDQSIIISINPNWDVIHNMIIQ